MGKPATLKVDIVTDATQTISELDSVSTKFDATDKAMDKTGSKSEALAGHFDETATKSSTVAGALGDLGGALGQVGGPIGKVGQGMEMLAPTIMGVAGASDLMTVATEKLKLGQIKNTAATIASKTANLAASAAAKVYAAAQWLLNAAMSANPIALVVIALAALVAGLIVAYKKSETFRKIVTAALNGVKTVFDNVGKAAKAVYDAVVGTFKRILDWFDNSTISTIIFGPFKAAYDLITGGPEKLYKDFQKIPAGIARAIKGVTKAITDPFSDALDWINKWVINPIKSVWNTMAGAINGIHFSVKVPGWVPFAGGKGFTFDPPDVPTLARGAYVSKASMAVIGEAGPEFVLPHRMLRDMLRAETGGQTVIINVTGALDPVSTARQIDSLLTAQSRRTRGVVRSGVTR